MSARRWSEADLQQARARLRESWQGPHHNAAGTAKRNKYGNRRLYWQGMYFDSQRELAAYQAFELQKLSGAIRGVARQISIPLTGMKRRIRIDFMTISNEGAIRFWDSKGMDDARGKLKRDLVREQFGIEIQLC